MSTTLPPIDRIAAWLACGAVPPCPHALDADESGMCRLCRAVKAEVVKAAAATEVFAEPA
jgi:hypothetical protein